LELVPSKRPWNGCRLCVIVVTALAEAGDTNSPIAGITATSTRTFRGDLMRTLSSLTARPPVTPASEDYNATREITTT
jgi:hypothetical protein